MNAHHGSHTALTSPMKTGVRGVCPRCGRGRLFGGYLKLAPRCSACGLDFSFADPADGPAFFVMSIVSFPVVAFAGWLEVSFSPPVWVHMLTSLPLLVIGCLALLRPLKGWIVCAQYIHKAAEARLADGSGDTGRSGDAPPRVS